MSGAAGSGESAPPQSGAAVIAATSARWEGFQGFNERDAFGTMDPEVIEAEVDGFCRRELGSGVSHYEFYASSVCGVHGLRLEDGRGVVLKVYGRDVERLRLEAVPPSSLPGTRSPSGQ